MKTIGSLLFSLLLISFISCGSGNDNKATSDNTKMDTAQKAPDAAATPAAPAAEPASPGTEQNKQESAAKKSETKKNGDDKTAVSAQTAPAQTAPAPASPAPPPIPRVALLRFSCKGGTHFYSTNMEEGMKAGCTNEGNVGFIYASQAPGTQAFYRFNKGKDHLYTTNKDEGMKAGFTYEGITGYINTSQTAGTKPLYRYSKETTDNSKGKDKTKGLDHFYTQDENEGTKAGYKYEAIAGYVFPSAN